MKWIIVTLFSLSLVIASSLMAGETGKISGRVVDEETKEPVPHANIIVEGKSLRAITDTDGYFSVINVPPGIYTVKAVGPLGYVSTKKTDVKVIQEQTTEVNISLTPDVWRATSDVIEHLTTEKIDFFTEDSVLIIGTYYSPYPLKKLMVVLFHMLSRNRWDWDPIAIKLWKIGYGVLTIDLRGHGESIMMGKKTLDFRKFSKEMYQGMILDAKSAVEYLEKEKNIVWYNLIVIGASIGGNVALNYAATDERVKGVVLLSAGLDYRGVKTEEAMREYGERPVLIVTSEEDKYAYQSAKKLYELAKGEKELKIYKNAGHGTRIFDKEEGLEDLILNWLEKVVGDERPKKNEK